MLSFSKDSMCESSSICIKPLSLFMTMAVQGTKDYSESKIGPERLLLPDIPHHEKVSGKTVLK